MKKLLSLILIVLFAGCYMIPPSWQPKPKMNFPADIKDQCNGAKNESEKIIESKGKNLKVVEPCTVHKMAGEKKFSGVWAWYDEGWKMYVCGLCNGKEIWIAVDPKDFKTHHGPTLIHEFCHYWLMSNYGDGRHISELDNSVFNWKHSRDVTGSTTDLKDDDVISILVVKDGVQIHVDGINAKK